jgi:hypothetical protein
VLVIATLGMIEFTTFECRRVLWRACHEFPAHTRNAWKLGEKIGPALLHKRRQLFLVI